MHHRRLHNSRQKTRNDPEKKRKVLNGWERGPCRLGGPAINEQRNGAFLTGLGQHRSGYEHTSTHVQLGRTLVANTGVLKCSPSAPLVPQGAEIHCLGKFELISCTFSVHPIGLLDSLWAALFAEADPGNDELLRNAM